MNRRRILLAAALLAAAFLGIRALRAWRTPDEDKVRAVLDAIEAACEARDVGGVVEHISERYRDADGLKKRELKGFLFAQFLGQKESISVQRLGGTEVALRPRSRPTAATATLRAAVSSGGTALGNALRGERFDFEVELEKEGDAWLVVSHRRRPVP